MKLMCLPSNRFLNFLRGCVSLKKTTNFYYLRNRTLCSCLKSFKSSDLFVTLRCSLGTCLLSPANEAFTFAMLPWDLAFTLTPMGPGFHFSNVPVPVTARVSGTSARG